MSDADGKSIGDELKRIGYAGSEPVGGFDVDSFFEMHIEQGPILENEGSGWRSRRCASVLRIW